MSSKLCQFVKISNHSISTRFRCHLTLNSLLPHPPPLFVPLAKSQIKIELTLSGAAFSVVRLAGRGGGGLRDTDVKNQGYHQPITINRLKMKVCMSRYSHKNIPDAKFESDSFFFYFWRYVVTKFLSGEEIKSLN